MSRMGREYQRVMGTAAFKDGYESCEKGMKRDANPCMFPVAKQYWYTGWDAADNERKDSS